MLCVVQLAIYNIMFIGVGRSLTSIVER